MTQDNQHDNAGERDDTGGHDGGGATEALTENPTPAHMTNAPSLVVLNTGNGKGKSSAAFGVMIRGIARGWNVAVVQFIKSSDWKVGEEKIGRELGVDWHALGEGFTWDTKNPDHDREVGARAWARATEIINSGQYQLVILDELTYLCSWGWVPTSEVVDVIRNRPPKVSLVITGRDAPDELIEVADTVTEMREVKHAFQRNIAAKRGIDY